MTDATNADADAAPAELPPDSWRACDYLDFDTEGAFLGREAEIPVVRHALATPGSLLVISGPPGIGKQSLIAKARDLDRAERRGTLCTGGLWHVKVQRGRTGDAVRAFLLRHRLPLPVPNTTELCLLALDAALRERDAVLVVSNVLRSEVEAEHVPIVRDAARTILLTTDATVADALRSLGHGDLVHLALGPLADQDLAALDDRPELERDSAEPSEDVTELIHLALLLGGLPRGIELLRRVLDPGEDGTRFDTAQLQRRLLQAGTAPDTDGIPASVRYLVRFALHQMSPPAREVLAIWAAIGTPRPNFMNMRDDMEGVEDVSAWGLDLATGPLLHPAVLVQVRAWPEYREAAAISAAGTLLKLLGIISIDYMELHPLYWQELHAALAILLERSHFDLAARTLRGLWPLLEANQLAEWLTEWALRILPHLSADRERAALRAYLGKAYLRLERPDLAQAHLRRAIAELQQLPPERLEPVSRAYGRVHVEGWARDVPVPPQLIDRINLMDPLDPFGDDEDVGAGDADIALEYETESHEQFVPNTDLIALAQLDLALTRVAMQEPSRAWRELEPALQSLARVTRLDWREAALRDAESVREAVMRAGPT